MFTAQLLAFAPLAALLLTGVTAVAYIMGRRSRPTRSNADSESGTPISGVVSRELSEISQGVRRRLATYHASILRFRERISQLSLGQDGAVWQLLAQETERVLKPTEELSDELAQAYNEIRQQTSNSPASVNDRLDILTGLESRESIERTIVFLLALKARYDHLFSLILVDIDNFGDFNRDHGRAEGDRVLRELADAIKDSVRDTDAAGRFDAEEFIIVLPETGLQGAGIFGERLREKVDQCLPISVSLGLATVADGDTPQTILSRVDSALYSAKSAGYNCVFQHSGRTINWVRGQDTTQVVERPESASATDAPETTVPTAKP